MHVEKKEVERFEEVEVWVEGESQMVMEAIKEIFIIDQATSNWVLAGQQKQKIPQTKQQVIDSLNLEQIGIQDKADALKAEIQINIDLLEA